MLTFTRTLKDGTAVEFKFACTHNNTYYEYINDKGIEFHFSIRDKNIAPFNIDVRRYEGLGYGTALISIMFEIIETYHKDVKFIYGKLSTSDFTDHGNLWQTSIPFYLKQKDNAYLIKCDRNLHMIYNTEDTNDYFNTKYYSYKDFIQGGASIGYIIYPLL